jgi:hypothetical protein
MTGTLLATVTLIVITLPAEAQDNSRYHQLLQSEAHTKTVRSMARGILALPPRSGRRRPILRKRSSIGR